MIVKKKKKTEEDTKLTNAMKTVFFLMCLLYSVAILLRSRRPFLSSTGRGCMYSPNPQRHNLVLFHRIRVRKGSTIYQSLHFFSLMSLVVCVLYVGLWDVKERIYNIV